MSRATVSTTVANVMEAIEFKHHQPSEPVEGLEVRLRQLPFRHENGLTLDVENTHFRSSFPLSTTHAIHDIPRMATIGTAVLIQQLVENLPERTMYLNIGVWHGYTFLAGLIGNAHCHCVGVDNFSQFGGPEEAFRQNFIRHRSDRHQFLAMDYKDYFREHHQGSIGMYLYDGAHDLDSQREALEIAHPHIATGGAILVDDTNWDDPRQATLDFLKAHPEYRLILDQRTIENGHPTFWNGIMVLVKN